MSSAVKVAVRLRPMNEKEQRQGTLPVVNASSVDNTITAVKGNGGSQHRSTFHFDHVFSSYTTQEQFFEATLKPVIYDVLQGFESTVFAYGQTGTGKTHTMEGDLSDKDSYGVIPRSAEQIFAAISRPEFISHSVVVSYLEIYNEELCDLLSDEDYRQRGTPKKRNKYEIVEGKDGAYWKTNTKLEIMEGKDGMVCRGLTQKRVHSASDVLEVMQTAQKHRKIGETRMNKQSSRSHCVFTITLSAKRQLGDGNIFDTRGKLHLVDLAGSECAKSAASNAHKEKRSESRDKVTRERGRERKNINRSLLTLGRVIIMLNEQSGSKSNRKRSQSVRIPYRDSKLTRILQDSLGGRCKTLIIATVSPSVLAIEETMSTLNYAQSASGIVNKPVSVSYISVNSSGSSRTTPIKDIDEGVGVETWREMEMRLEYMESQMAEAQAALARQYREQKSIIDRAEKAEKELTETKGKLETTEENLVTSYKIIEGTRQVLHTQQHEIANAKVEQKQFEEQFVKQVLQGVTIFLNDHMKQLSLKHDKQLTAIDLKNNALSTLANSIQSSANNIVDEVKTTSIAIRKHSQQSHLNDEKMKAAAEGTTKVLSSICELSSEQKNRETNCINEVNKKLNVIAEQKREVTSTCTNLTKDGQDVNTFISETVPKGINTSISKLADSAASQSNYIRNTVLQNTSARLDKMERPRSIVLSNFSNAANSVIGSMIEGRDEIISRAKKQSATADEIRTDVESKYNEYKIVTAGKRNSVIETRTQNITSISKDFIDLSKTTLSSTASSIKQTKMELNDFSTNTIKMEKDAPPLDAKIIIEYNKTLSSTPTELELFTSNE